MEGSTVAYRLKFDRARSHADALEGMVRPWCGERQEGAFRIERQGETDDYVIWFIGTTDPPETWGGVIGDCLHNLRSGLDHLAFELAVAYKGILTDSEAGNSEFPIFGKRAMRSGELRSKIGCIDPEAQAVIQGLQPHLRGDRYSDDPLWLVYELSNIDKHRLLHVVTVGSMGAAFGGVGSNFILRGPAQLGGSSSEPGTKVGFFTATAADVTRPMDMKLDLGLGIRFADGPAKDRDSAAPAPESAPEASL